MLNLYSIYINTNNGIEDTAALMGLITFHAALVSIIIILVVHPHQPVSHVMKVRTQTKPNHYVLHAVKVPIILILMVYTHHHVSHAVRVPTIIILEVYYHQPVAHIVKVPTILILVVHHH